MKNAGRFDTSTKTKIRTTNGTILKVDIYTDGYHHEEYRIRPTCHICRGKMDCVCYNEDNCEDPLKFANEDLLKAWTCARTECVVGDLKENEPEYYQDLHKEHGDDIEAIADEIRDNWDGLNEGDFCY